MKVQYIRIWQTKPILEKLFMTSENGRLRRHCKHNIAKMDPFFQDCIEEAKKWMEENDVKGDTMPFDNPEFLKHFESFLLSTDEMVDYTPYTFSEELMEFADGITGTDELIISWLFDENQPKDEEEKDE